MSSQPALVDVIGIISQHCYHNPTAKGLAYALRDFSIYGLIVATLIFTDTWWLLVPLWLIAGLAVSGLSVLGHDASRGALFRSRRLNRVIARVAMLPAAHFEEAWDLGHNRVHHGHTVKQGMDFVWHPITFAEWDEMPRWQRLRHKVEWSAIGAGFYYGRQVWWNKMMMFAAPEKWAKKINRGRIQMLLTLVFAAAMIGLVGWLRQDTFASAAWTWVKVALIPWLLFTWIIGYAVYVHHITSICEFRSTNFLPQPGQSRLRIPTWFASDECRCATTFARRSIANFMTSNSVCGYRFRPLSDLADCALGARGQESVGLVRAVNCRVYVDMSK